MKQFVFIFLFICFFNGNSQVFTYSGSNTNMVDVPAGTMLWNVTFSNPSPSPISIQFERYQKYNPPYWFSCFCYIQCNPPGLDTITINLAASSSSMLTVLFKTDSVNPGTATSSIRIYQVGFANNSDTVHLNATTNSLTTGITKNKLEKSFFCYPNPTKNEVTLNIILNESYSILINDLSGKVINQYYDLNEKKYSLNLESYLSGEYNINLIYKSGKTYTKKIIKN